MSAIAADAGRREARDGLVLGLAYLVVALLVYGRARGYPFLLDDVFHFQDNPTVKSLRGLPRIWASSYWELYTAGLYRPLLKTLWVGEHVLLGGGRGAVVATGVALHALCATLLALLARRIGASAIAAAAVGAWFLLHPAHVEVVISGVGQGETAGLALVLAALWLVFGDVRLTRTRVLAFVACGLAATLVKEQGFPALGLLLAALWLSPSASTRLRLEGTAALGAGVVAVLALRYVALGALGPQGGFVVAEGLGAGRLLLAPAMVGRYVVLAFAPHGLGADYSWLTLDLSVGLGDGLLWLGLAVVAASVAAAVFALRRGDRALAVALLAFWLGLAPFLHLWPIGNFFAERHAYHALAGMALLLAWAMARPSARRAPWATALLAAVVVQSAVFGVVAARRTTAWQSGFRLWETTLRDHPRSFFAAGELAILHLRAGDLAEAERHARLAYDLAPDYPVAQIAMADVEMARGRVREAHRLYAEAATSPVHGVEARVGLVLALVELGRMAEAHAELEKLVAERPGDVQVRQAAARVRAAERGRLHARPLR